MLGVNAGVVLAVLPELALLIGEQPAPVELGPTEEQNRFHTVFHNFISALARPHHPLVVFLDDLQWADSATLKFLEVMLSGGQTKYLFIVGAYRDNEVGPAHPLLLTLEALKKSGVTLSEISLSALSQDHLDKLLHDTLGDTETSVRELAHLIEEKTNGNPFFARQFIQALYADDLLHFAHDTRLWTWDIARLNRREFTDNVVDLMTARLQALPADTRNALRFAACLGNTFSLRRLAIITEKDPALVEEHLLPALQENLIVAESLDNTDGAPANDADAHRVTASTATRAEEDGKDLQESHRWRFTHDRVQQAAYSLVDEEQVKHIHLRIGRLLLHASNQLDDTLFEITDHLNRGRELIEEEAERVQLAELNLRTGQRAKHAAAYDSARYYIEIGMSQLPLRSWETHYSLTSSLFRERAETEYLSGNFDTSEEFISRVIERSRTNSEKAEIYNLRIVQYTLSARYSEAMNIGREALTLIGITLPPEGTPQEELDQALSSEMAAVEARLAKEPYASLIAYKEDTDHESILAMQLLNNLFVPSYVLKQGTLYFIIAGKIIDLSLRDGVCTESCFGFSSYGVYLGSVLGKYQEGYEYGRVAIELGKRFGKLNDVCRACYILGNNILSWVRPLEEAEPLFREGYQAGLDSGELQFAAYILVYMLLNPFFRGSKSDEITSQMAEALRFAARTQNQLAVDTLIGLQLVLDELRGEPTPLAETEGLDSEQYIAMCRGRDSQYALCHYLILKTKTAYIHRDIEQCMYWSSEAEQETAAIIGKYQTAALTFYRALAIIATLHDQDEHVETGARTSFTGNGTTVQSPSKPAEARDDRVLPAGQKTKLLNELSRCRDMLKQWAANSPDNFLHKHYLVEAEYARMRGDTAAAADAYDHAITTAQASGFVNIEAIANELAGRFWLRRGRKRVGMDYLHNALQAYWAWGLWHKRNLLLNEFPDFATINTPSISALPVTLSATAHANARFFDVMAVLKMTRAISEEIVFDRLLATVMKTLIEDAGAQRGYLMLWQNDALIAAALGNSTPPDYRALPPQPLSELQHELCAAVVYYVERSRESVVVADVSADAQFGGDLYVKSTKAKSILCAPIMGHGALKGIIYLENNLARGVFNHDTLQMVQILAAQAAISIENAQLYENLEQRVKERTQELHEAQRQLVDTAHRAGMAEVAVNILHNVGNLTTSIGVAVEYARELSGKSQSAQLHQAAAVLDKSQEQLEPFLRANKGVLLAKYLRALADEDDKQRNEYDNTLANVIGKLDHLRKIIHLQRSNLGGLHLIEDVSVHEIIEEALAICLVSDDHKGVEIKREFADLGTIPLDRHRLQLILINLINNALRALRDCENTRDGKYLTVRTALQEQLQQVHIEVVDNGVGISADNLVRIFRHGFTTRRDGHGFGLHSSANASAEMNGTLNARSDGLGHGATFTLTLPLVPPQPTSEDDNLTAEH